MKNLTAEELALFRRAIGFAIDCSESCVQMEEIDLTDEEHETLCQAFWKVWPEARTIFTE